MIHQGVSMTVWEGEGAYRAQVGARHIIVWDKWPVCYFQIHRNYLSVRDAIWRTWVHALKRGHKAVKAQPCLFLQRMLTPSAFLYSCAVLNYHCKGKAAIPEGSRLGEKWQRRLEYPADCKHLSSCRLLTPLCLQPGMAFTLILAGQGLAKTIDNNKLDATWRLLICKRSKLWKPVSSGEKSWKLSDEISQNDTITSQSYEI